MKQTKFSVMDTPWGVFGYVVRDQALLKTFLPTRADSLRQAIRGSLPDAIEQAGLLPSFERQVKAYFKGERAAFDLSIDLSDVSAFRQRVLDACRRIPYGQVASYADLARIAGSPQAARAAGSAMANNPLPLVVPCHRVLCSDGTLGGFSSPQGVEQKKRLLHLEGIKDLTTRKGSIGQGATKRSTRSMPKTRRTACVA